MPPASRAFRFFGHGYPQLALWATGIASAPPTGVTYLNLPENSFFKTGGLAGVLVWADVFALG